MSASDKNLRWLKGWWEAEGRRSSLKREAIEDRLPRAPLRI